MNLESVFIKKAIEIIKILKQNYVFFLIFTFKTFLDFGILTKKVAF